MRGASRRPPGAHVSRRRHSAAAVASRRRASPAETTDPNITALSRRRPKIDLPRDLRACSFEAPIHNPTEEIRMPDYIPSPRQWVRDQVELYERSGGTEGTTLRDTGLPVVIVTHTGNKTGAIRKTPLMRVKDRANYVLIGAMGGAPKNPGLVYNLRTNPPA